MQTRRKMNKIRTKPYVRNMKMWVKTKRKLKNNIKHPTHVHQGERKGAKQYKPRVTWRQNQSWKFGYVPKRCAKQQDLGVDRTEGKSKEKNVVGENNSQATGIAKNVLKPGMTLSK